MSGKTDEAKGRLKEAAGTVTGDDQLRREGRLDRVAGNAKDAVDKVKDRVAGAMEGRDGRKGRKGRD